jgi:hypothetical protein
MKIFGVTRPGTLALIGALLLNTGCVTARLPETASPPRANKALAPVSSLLAPGTRGDYLPTGIVASSTRELKAPAWVSRALSRATGLGQPGFAQAAGGVLSASAGGLGGYAGAGLVMGYLMYLPVGAAVGAIVGMSSARKWRPCIEGLSQELVNIDAAALLSRELADTLGKHGPAPTAILTGDPDQQRQQAARQGLKSLLRAEISSLALKECPVRGAFCVEVVLTARLEDLAGQKVFFDRRFVYTGSQSLKKAPGESQTFEPVACRGMADYCGPEGRRIFREEISRDIHYFADQLLFHLGLLSGPELKGGAVARG